MKDNEKDAKKNFLSKYFISFNNKHCLIKCHGQLANLFDWNHSCATD